VYLDNSIKQGLSTTDYVAPQISVSLPWCWLETFIAVSLCTGEYSAVHERSFSMASVKMFHSSASLRCSLLESAYLPRSENNWIALRNVFSISKLETSRAVSLHDGEHSAQNLFLFHGFI